MYINVYIICRTHLFVTRVSDYMAARAHEQKYQGKKREKKMEFIPGVRKQTQVLPNLTFTDIHVSNITSQALSQMAP